MKIKDVLQLQLSLLQISGNSTLSEDWRNRLQEVDEEEGMVISNSRYSDICLLHLDILKYFLANGRFYKSIVQTGKHQLTTEQRDKEDSAESGLRQEGDDDQQQGGDLQHHKADRATVKVTASEPTRAAASQSGGNEIFGSCSR